MRFSNDRIFWSRDGVNVYITRNHRISRNAVNLATACCSCLVDVGLIRRGFREGGIKVLIILGADARLADLQCSISGLRTLQGRTASSGYSASQTCTVCVQS